MFPLLHKCIKTKEDKGEEEEEDEGEEGEDDEQESEEEKKKTMKLKVDEGTEMVQKRRRRLFILWYKT